MNQGDYQSGPVGYSPSTAYPETEYGSALDQDGDSSNRPEDDYTPNPTAGIAGDIGDYSGNESDWRRSLILNLSSV